MNAHHKSNNSSTQSGSSVIDIRPYRLRRAGKMRAVILHRSLANMDRILGALKAEQMFNNTPPESAS